MIDNIKKYVVGVVIGIRFGPNFSITGDFGRIADKILYKKDSFFNEKMFPVVSMDPLKMRLENGKTGDNLTISSRDLILTCNFINKDLSLDKNLEPKIKIENLPELNSRFDQDIINGVIKEFRFNRISRIGYINRYIFQAEGNPKKLINKTIGPFEGVNDINLRFSKKYPTPEALVAKKVNDYHNVIFNIIKKADKDELFISVDYQAYYEPALESVADSIFQEFLSLMQEYNSETFSKWLNNRFGD